MSHGDIDRPERPEPLAPPLDDRSDEPRELKPEQELFLICLEAAGPKNIIDALIQREERKLKALRALRLLVPEKCDDRERAEAIHAQIRAVMNS